MSTPELDASMGRPSTFKTGSTGTKSADAPAPKPKPELTDEHKASLVEHLKNLLGIDHTPVMGEKNPANAGTLNEAGVTGALNRGIADGTKAGPE